MAGATFARVKTWITGETLTAAQLNAEFDNVLDNLDPTGIDDESADDSAARATSDPYASSSLVKATSLETEIQQLRYLIAQITGETYWYIDADTNIAAIAANSWVTAARIASNAVETAKIKDANVTTAKLAADSVTGPKLSAGTYPWLGFVNRSIFTYNGAAVTYTIKVKPGTYHVKDKLASWVAELTTGAVGTPSADTWYYLYLDYSGITEGTNVTNSELLWSDTAPTWSNAYAGLYNSDDRCIMAVKTNSGPTNILEFFHQSDEVVYGDAISVGNATAGAAWAAGNAHDVPAFTNIKALVTLESQTNSNTSNGVLWRPSAATSTTGHRLCYIEANGAAGLQPKTAIFPVILGGSYKLDYKQITAGETVAEYTSGWFFPIGM